HRRKHDRDQRAADQFDPRHQVLAPKLRRAASYRLRAHAAVAPAGLVVAEQRAAVLDQAVTLGGKIACHQSAVSSEGSAAAREACAWPSARAMYPLDFSTSSLSTSTVCFMLASAL